jgi:hypothetical protein
MHWINKIFRRTKGGPGTRDISERHFMDKALKNSASISADNPIRKIEDDVLGRAKSAQSFTEQVLSLDVTEGMVVGILGPWGSGVLATSL